ncbi:MAG: DinB family protein [Vicinamibacterales bacterium]
MDRATRQHLIQEYKDGYRVVSEALEGASDAELDARPAQGKWSTREIVHHLADSEMTAAVRLRMLLATPQPQIVAYDQEEFARRLHYDRPVEQSLDVLRAVRASTAELLDRLTETEWLREGMHSESGRYSVERWLELYAAHAVAHAQQIRIARNAAKPR